MSGLSEWFLKVVLPESDRRHVLDELDELYDVHRQQRGETGAEEWRRRQIRHYILKALPTFWWKRPLSGFLGLLSNRDGPLGLLDHLGQDLRFSFRSFLRRPGLVLATTLILGVGIGATTAIYSVVDTVMLRPLPYPDQGELVHFGGYGGVRPRLFIHWRDDLGSFEAVEASRNVHMTLTGGTVPRAAQVAMVTPGLLGTLGATPHRGRLLSQEDYRSDASVALLSHAFWQREWGGDPSLVGQSIQVEGRPVVVAGILDPDFRPPEGVTGRQVDLWTPLVAEDPESMDWNILSVMGRLRDGVDMGAAQAELDVLTEHLSADLPDVLLEPDGHLRLTQLLPLQLATARSVLAPLVLLVWAVLLMLAIACANVANLLLAHGVSRVRELSLRAALGAARGRIIRQLLTESVFLALAGGALGVGLAYLSVEGFRRFIPSYVPRIQDLAVDPRVLLFALAASVATGLIFGMMPALHASRRNVVRGLNEGGKASTGSRRGRRTRNLLVVSEMAMALVLLTAGSLFFRSLVASGRVELGFETEQLVTVPLHLGGSYDATQREVFTQEMRELLGSQPGIQGVAAGLTVPFQYVGASRCCISDEVIAIGGGEGAGTIHTAMIHPVSQGYFQTLGTRVVYGREFQPEDDVGAQSVAIINEATARYLFGDGDAVGRSFTLRPDRLFTVVGVVEGVHHWGVSAGIEPNIYLPYAQRGSFSDIYQLLIRSTLDLEVLAPRIRQAIASVDPDLPVEEIVPMVQRVEASRAGQRILTILLATFAGVALILATGGIYASMLYSVGQRRQEMGIRMALGAKGSQVVGMVLRGGLGLTLGGVALGLGGSIALARLLQSRLYGISATDPVTLAGVATVLGAAALLACLIPALGAARANPVDTLTVD